MALFVLGDTQHTDSGNYDLREEDEPWFPWCLTRLHTKPSQYKHGLGDDKGRMAETEGEEALTRHIAMGRFPLLTKQGMNILPGYPGVLY